MSKYKNEYLIKGDVALVDISTDTFPDSIMALDVEDLERILGLGRCSAWEGTRDRATPKYGKVRDKYIHRIVNQCPKGLQVDHINGNGIDNTKKNLRNVSNRVNGMNTAISQNNTSGRIGVGYVKRTGKWEEHIKVNYIKINLGTYATKEEATVAREAAEKLYGFHENHGRCPVNN